MAGTCWKRTISVPELETSRHERWEQKLTKEIRKQEKIFYHLHIYVNNVGPCNFLRLFPCSLTYLMFPCCQRYFCFVPMFPLPNFPCSPKTPGGPSNVVRPLILKMLRCCVFVPHSVQLEKHWNWAQRTALFFIR